MKEEHLCETPWECDFSSTEPKYTEHFRNTCCGQDEVSHSQHGEKEEHGFVKAPLYSDKVEENAVSHNSHNVDDTEGNPNPHMILLQAWNSNQNEGSWVITA